MKCKKETWDLDVLEGSVEDLIKFLSSYPKNAKISIDEQRDYGYERWKDSYTSKIVIEK